VPTGVQACHGSPCGWKRMRALPPGTREGQEGQDGEHQRVDRLGLRQEVGLLQVAAYGRDRDADEEARAGDVGQKRDPQVERAVEVQKAKIHVGHHDQRGDEEPEEAVEDERVEEPGQEAASGLHLKKRLAHEDPAAPAPVAEVLPLGLAPPPELDPPPQPHGEDDESRQGQRVHEDRAGRAAHVPAQLPLGDQRAARCPDTVCHHRPPPAPPGPSARAPPRPPETAGRASRASPPTLADSPGSGKDRRLPARPPPAAGAPGPRGRASRPTLQRKRRSADTRVRKDRALAGAWLDAGASRLPIDRGVWEDPSCPIRRNSRSS